MVKNARGILREHRWEEDSYSEIADATAKSTKLE